MTSMNLPQEQRWAAIAEPGWEVNPQIFAEFHRRTRRRNVLSCAVPLTRAKVLTDFVMPAGWNADKCIEAGIGLGGYQGKLPPGLENWDYTPHIAPVPQMPWLKPIPKEHENLLRSPWFQTPSQATFLGLNARHLRYHYDLWQQLQPRTLRGVFTTLVFVTPQFGHALTSHIKLDDVFHYFGALSRPAGPVQLFPAGYLYPDARLCGMERVPAAMFADILPFLGAALPVMDIHPDPWGTLVRLGMRDRYFTYPFQAARAHDDTTLRNYFLGEIPLPNGRLVRARSSESFAYATLDPQLNEALRMEKEQFQAAYCLNRGTVTHDGLPFLLPVEMQAAVFAVITTAWELTLDRPGDLTSYTLKTQHAAIRGFDFYQRQERFPNFMRLIHELARDPLFETYPLATHLTYPWLGGNLCLANQQSEGERILGARFMRNYYLQQLDWSMGIFNLWNHIPFRRQADLQNQLAPDGVLFHQMRPQLRHDSHYFPRPLKRVSFWPDFNDEWFAYDQTYQTDALPLSDER